MKVQLLQNSPIIAAVAALFAIGAVAAGCDEDAQSPQDVATEFVGELRAGDNQQAMEMIWPPTREQLETPHQELSAYFEGDAPLGPDDMLVATRVESPMLINRIDPKESVPEQPADGEHLELKLEFRDDRTARVDMRFSQEDARWYVDLPLDDRRPLRVLEDDRDDDADHASPGADAGQADGNPAVDDGTTGNE